MRLAIVSDTPRRNMGGVERFTYSLVDVLRKRNITVDIYDQGNLGEYLPRWYDKFGLQMPRRSQLLGMEAIRKIPESKPVVNVIMQNGISGWNIREQAGPPRIVVHHGTWRGNASYSFPANTRLRTRVARYVLTDRMLGGLEKYTSTGATSVSVSGAVAAELMHSYAGIRSVVIPNGIDTTHFSKLGRGRCREIYGIGPDKYVACFTGRIEIGKGADILLEIARKAWRERPEIKFLIATDSIPTDWPANVLFVKNVGYEELPQVYSAADVFLFPTRYEGCSYSLLEAMACELPIITGRVGYAADIHRDIPEIAPLILAEDDVATYWKALTVLAENNISAGKLGKIGVEYVRTHNTLDAMADSYVNLITQVARKEVRV